METNYAIPPSPLLPDPFQQQRARRQLDRYQIVSEDYGSQDTLVSQWVEAQVGAAAAEALGPPDLSANTLLAASVQLSTPGLYGLGEPTLTHAEKEAEELTRWLRDSGYWTRMQFVQRMVVGLGDWVLALEVVNGCLCIHNAYPWQISTRTAPHRADQLLEVRWLRLRCPNPENPQALAWYWDCYRLDGPEPVFQVLSADFQVDWSNVFIEVDGGYAPVGGLTGERYPYRYKDGTPFLPFVFYADCDDGQCWHDSSRRGATRGALNSIVASTFSLRALFSAAMPPAVAVNLKPPSAAVQNVGRANSGGSSTTQSFPAIPGTILFTYTEPAEAQSAIHQLSVAGNLQALNQGVDRYQASQFTRLGIASDDIQRDSANPTSAAALSISRAAKRERALLVQPFFQKRDLELIRMVAALASSAGLGDWPEDGWELQYQAIPQTPEEAQAKREDLDWKKKNGLISQVDLYLAEHPGVSRAEAIAALKRIAAEEAALKPEKPVDSTAIPTQEKKEE